MRRKKALEYRPVTDRIRLGRTVENLCDQLAEDLVVAASVRESSRFICARLSCDCHIANRNPSRVQFLCAERFSTCTTSGVAPSLHDGGEISTLSRS